MPASQEISSELAHALGDDIRRITCSAVHDTRSSVNNQMNLEGYVYKRGGNNTDFKRRFFSLQDGVLRYFITKRKLVKRGFVPCTGLSVIEDAGEHEDEDNGKLYCFELIVQEAALRTHRSSILCGVDSTKKRELWVSTLIAAVGAPTVLLPFLITPAENVSPSFISGDIKKQLSERDSQLMQVIDL